MIGMGFDPIWFGIMVVIVCEMGMIVPPVGMNVFVIKGMARMCRPIPFTGDPAVSLHGPAGNNSPDCFSCCRPLASQVL